MMREVNGWDQLEAMAGLVAQVQVPDLADALCREVDPELFFPERGGNAFIAQQVCARCDVLEACREWALGHKEPHGTWGGLNERQRRRGKRRPARLAS